MSLKNTKTHYFDAEASALGGHLERPFVKDIPIQSGLSLSPAGGTADAFTSNFRFDDVLSASATHSRIEGTYIDGLATTRATAAVEDLSVVDRVRADEVVVYISSTYPGEHPHVPKIDFGRTRITNLRVDDAVLRVKLNLDLLNNGDSDCFPERHPVFDSNFWTKINRPFDETRHSLPCTLVEQLEVVRGELPGTIIPPNILELPGIGRVHIAELLLSGNSYQVIMLRFALGCPVQGQIGAASGKTSGSGGGG